MLSSFLPALDFFSSLSPIALIASLQNPSNQQFNLTFPIYLSFRSIQFCIIYSLTEKYDTRRVSALCLLTCNIIVFTKYKVHQCVGTRSCTTNANLSVFFMSWVLLHLLCFLSEIKRIHQIGFRPESSVHSAKLWRLSRWTRCL